MAALNKKGSFELGHEVVIFLWRLTIVVTVLFVLVAAIIVHLSRRVDAGNFEGYLITDYIAYSNNCLGLLNNNLDFQKDTSNCLSNQNAAANLTLKDLNGKIISSRLINGDTYNQNIDFCNQAFSNFICVNRTFYSQNNLVTINSLYKK